MDALTRAIAFTILAVTLPATAHHSPAAYDQGVEVMLSGTVTDYSWQNPHVYLTIEMLGANGEPISQRIEAGPAAILAPWGLAADSVHKGDRVTVRANPNRAGPGRIAMGLQLTKADASTVPLHVRGIDSSRIRVDKTASIVGTWVPEPSGFTALAIEMRAWPLSEQGRRALSENHSASERALSECVPYGAPMLMVLPVAIVVERRESTVVLKVDWINVERVVHLDGSHPADPKPTLQGHSIGHWEAGTLVVDTVGFTEQPEGYGFDVPASTAKHITERFTLSDDSAHLDYEITVEDALYLSRPVTHRSRWAYRPDQAPAGVPCDLEVARRFLTNE